MSTFDTARVVTQAEFGELVGIGQSAVSRLCSAGVLPSPLLSGPALLAYCARLRDQAEGRIGSEAGGLDLAHERAALAREQRRGIELKNAVLRGDYADASLLGEVLAAARQAVVEGFDDLPGQVREACPDLPTAAVDQVMAVIAGARNEWLRGTVALVGASVPTGEDDDDQALVDVDDEPRTD